MNEHNHLIRDWREILKNYIYFRGVISMRQGTSVITPYQLYKLINIVVKN